MCLAKQAAYSAAAPAAAQPATQAATTPGGTPNQRRRALGGLASTLLTGPSGIATAGSTTGANTLLGA